jgi:hypothetical protein
MFHLIVLQMFDNAAFYARSYEGGLIICQRELVRGTYHTDGDVVVQPVEALEAVFNDFQPIFLMPVVAHEFSSCLCWLVTSELAAAMTMRMPKKGLTRGSAPSSSPP